MQARTLAWIVFVTALAIRLVLVVPMPADHWKSRFSSDNTNDSKAYVDIGRSIVEHGVYGYGGRPSAYRPPLYPGILAAFFGTVGENFRAVRIFQAILGGLAALALFGIGRTFFDRWTGFLAGLALGLYPFAIYFAGTIMTEPVFLALATSTIYLVARLLKDGPKPAWIVAAGVLAGLSTLCRPTFVPMLAMMIAFGAGGYVLKPLARARGLALVGVIGVLLVVPWLVRNSVLYGKPMFITTYTGLNLYSGLPGKDQVTEFADFGYNYHTIEDPSIKELPKPEPEMEKEHSEYYRRFVRENPGLYAKEKLGDAIGFWFDYNLAGPLGANIGAAALAAFGSYAFILVFGICGTVLAVRRGNYLPVVLAWLLIGLTFCLTIMIFAGKRYRVPTVDPYLMLFAAYFFVDRFGARVGWKAGSGERVAPS